MRHVRMGVHCATHSGPCMYDYTYTDRTTHIHIRPPSSTLRLPSIERNPAKESRKKKYKDIHIHRQYGIMKTKRHKHRIPKMCEYAPYRNM